MCFFYKKNCQPNKFIWLTKQGEMTRILLGVNSMTDTKILKYLEIKKGEIVSGGQLAQRLQVSRTAIWKAIHKLIEQGHDIETMPNRGYRLKGKSDGIYQEGISAKLKTENLGKEIEILQSIDSTNTYLKEIADLKREGFVVVANEQSRGRGRQGRKFISPANEGIYMSVLLKPDFEINIIKIMTVLAAVAVSNALKSLFNIETNIKWVNDIYVNNKKICGILTEATVSAELGVIENLYLGIGINTGIVANEVKSIATSVFELTSERGIRNDLIAEVLNEVERIYKSISNDKKKGMLLNEYTKRLMLVNEIVLIKAKNYEFEAKILGVDSTGALLIEKEGRTQKLVSGEINYGFNTENEKKN